MKNTLLFILGLLVMATACQEEATTGNGSHVKSCSFTDEYYCLVNSAEEKFRKLEYKASYDLYKCAFEQQDMPLKTDAKNMAISAFALGYEQEAKAHLQTAMSQGLPLDHIQGMRQLKSFLTTPSYQALEQSYHQTRLLYNQQLDSSFLASLATLRAELDQEYPLRRDDFESFVTKDVQQLANIMQQSPIACILEMSTKGKKDMLAILQYACYFESTLSMAIPLFEQSCQKGIITPKQYIAALKKGQMNIQIRTGENKSELFQATFDDLTTRGLTLKGSELDELLQDKMAICLGK